MAEQEKVSELDSSMRKARGFLAVAIVTKFAALLTGAAQLQRTLALTDEMAAYKDVLDDGPLAALAALDAPLSLVTIVFFCLWLARATAAGRVSFAKEGWPRRMGAFCWTGLAASALTTLVALGSTVVKAVILMRSFLPLDGAMSPLQIPEELPVAFLRLDALTLVVLSFLQLIVFAFFRILVKKAMEEEPAPEESVKAAPPEKAEEESKEGFGWPEQPTRLAVLAILVSATLFGAVDDPYTPVTFGRVSEDDIETNSHASLRGIVSFVSGIDSNLFYVADFAYQGQTSVAVLLPEGASRPSAGDLVLAEGYLGRYDTRAALEATQVDVIRREELMNPGLAKQADFRRGLLYNRRVLLDGTVRAVSVVEEDVAFPRTVLKVRLDNHEIEAILPGVYKGRRLADERVRLTGLARQKIGSDDKVIDNYVELQSADDIVLLRAEDSSDAFYGLLVLGAAILLGMSVMLAALWLIGRRERREMALIAAERRRMAADLHDTIEQHLAGANLIAAGVLAQEDTPDDVREAMKALAALLANAKAEVRSAVLNLRSETDRDETLKDAIVKRVAALGKTGVQSRSCLRALPEHLPEGMKQDILLIINEAVTNAVKHGKAKCVIITSDPEGAQGFRLRVLNDGAPFEVERALGPDMGHYGLSGMRERALRNNLRISWGRKDEWTYMELISKGGQS